MDHRARNTDSDNGINLEIAERLKFSTTTSETPNNSLVISMPLLSLRLMLIPFFPLFH